MEIQKQDMHVCDFEHFCSFREERSFREELKRGQAWQTPMCARVGLEYYNSMNQVCSLKFVNSA
jgi:hypothetical protein